MLIMIITTHNNPPDDDDHDHTSASVQVKTVRQATHVRACPPANSGSEEIVPLDLIYIPPPTTSNSSHNRKKKGDDDDVDDNATLTLVAQKHSLPHARFNFQKTIFCYQSPDSTANEYRRLTYPVEGEIASFLGTKGYKKNEEAALALSIWGENIFDIPLPPFADLFKVRGGGNRFFCAPGCAWVCTHTVAHKENLYYHDDDDDDV